MQKYLDNYNTFVNNQDQLMTSVFACGCLNFILKNKNTICSTIMDRPFYTCFNIVSSGTWSTFLTSMLVWFFPRSKYIVLPFCLTSLFFKLFVRKSTNTIGGKTKSDQNGIIFSNVRTVNVQTENFQTEEKVQE